MRISAAVRSLAFRYSDGDLEMLQWTTLTDGIRFGMLIHTDAERECLRPQVACRPLDVALDQAATNQWTVVDMKRDWKIIFPFKNSEQQKCHTIDRHCISRRN